MGESGAYPRNAEGATLMQHITERRRHDRFTVEPMYSSVTVRRISRGVLASEATEGHVYNVSLGGMRFELDEPLPKGALISIELELPGCDALICATARIVRLFSEIDDPGPRRMAIEFESFAQDSRVTLERHLSQKWLRAETPRFTASRIKIAHDSAALRQCELTIETSASTLTSSRKTKSASAA